MPAADPMSSPKNNPFVSRAMTPSERRAEADLARKKASAAFRDAAEAADMLAPPADLHHDFYGKVEWYIAIAQKHPQHLAAVQEHIGRGLQHFHTKTMNSGGYRISGVQVSQSYATYIERRIKELGWPMPKLWAD